MVQPSRPASKRSVTLPKGFRAASGAFGIKPSGKPDLALIVADQACSAAGVFTRNRCVGAPVTVSKQHLRNGQARAIVVNAGCANVMTGEQGRKDALTMCRETASAIGCRVSDVLPASTGIIGHPLPMPNIVNGISALGGRLQRGAGADAAASQAILTTDLVTKSSSRRIRIQGETVTIAGIAKGSGMIQPNMATMLAFITTDAQIDPATLKTALQQSSAASFNRISVDHDTSTSDMALVLASGAAKAPRIKPGTKHFADLCKGLDQVCSRLAEQIICDGEGATRVFEVVIKNAWSEQDADKIGYAVTGSPLVKTAVHGGDPNWGRILAAAGRSGARVNPAQTSLKIGGVPVLQSGRPRNLTLSKQTAIHRVMNSDRIRFELELGFPERNVATARWLGCDLSRDYVKINADYTT